MLLVSFLSSPPPPSHRVFSPIVHIMLWWVDGVKLLLTYSRIWAIGACNAGDFCLVDQYCCPGGLDATACALSYGVTLPATYVASTPTPAGTAPATVTDSVYIATPSVPSPTVSVAVYTGAANANAAVGYTGLLSGLLALLGGLF
jgi:hypothetical protein